MAGKTRGNYNQNISEQVKTTTENPATRGHALRYTYGNLWSRSLNTELDKVDANGTIQRLKSAELNLIPKKTKIITIIVSFNYKRNMYGTIEELKSRPSLRGDQMLPHFHFNSEKTSAPMVGRISARLVVIHSVGHGCILEHFDIWSAFLHKDYK